MRQHRFQVPIIVSFLTLISFISCIFVYFEKKTIRFDCKCAELRSSFSCYGFLTLCVNPQLFKGTVVIFNNIIMNSLSENLFSNNFCIKDNKEQLMKVEGGEVFLKTQMKILKSIMVMLFSF